MDGGWWHKLSATVLVCGNLLPANHEVIFLLELCLFQFHDAKLAISCNLLLLCMTSLGGGFGVGGVGDNKLWGMGVGVIWFRWVRGDMVGRGEGGGGGG